MNYDNLRELVNNNNIEGLKNIDFLSFNDDYYGENTQASMLCVLPFASSEDVNAINPETIQTLVNLGADVNFNCMPNHYDEHVSHRAVMTGQLDVVETLAELGTDFTLANAYGANACDDAHNNYSDIYNFLTENEHCELTGSYTDADSSLNS